LRYSATIGEDVADDVDLRWAAAPHDSGLQAFRQKQSDAHHFESVSLSLPYWVTVGARVDPQVKGTMLDGSTASARDLSRATYASDDSRVVAVEADGSLRAVGFGRTTVHVTADGTSADDWVEVARPGPRSATAYAAMEEIDACPAPDHRCRVDRLVLHDFPPNTQVHGESHADGFGVNRFTITTDDRGNAVKGYWYAPDQHPTRAWYVVDGQMTNVFSW
jgi:hypothetical protein